MKIIQEDNFADIMKDEVEPYLYAHCRECYITGAKEPERREKNGKLHVKFYETDRPKGVIIISHGFTEGAQKYDEMIYYFLKAGYHVCMPEHMGHGLSYRLTEDPSLVHIDTWKRYIRDFLKICQMAKKEYPNLPLNLFAHSMGGAIGAIAVSWKPEWFQHVILNSPMIRPHTANVPWGISASVSTLQCLIGKAEHYVLGQKPYEASETFETSASTSKPRFTRFNERRKATKEMQTCAASYSWLSNAAKMNTYLMRHAWKKYTAPMLIIQAEQDDYVWTSQIQKFADKIKKHGIAECEYLYLSETKHETYSSNDETMDKYINKILAFLQK